jgi:hypothetical protein
VALQNQPAHPALGERSRIPVERTTTGQDGEAISPIAVLPSSTG